MNVTTPLQGTTTVVNQLDENIKVAAEDVLFLIYNKHYPSYFSMGNTEDFKQDLFNIIKRNIEGNVNWKVG